MKKVLILSVIVNVLLISLLVYVILRKEGISNDKSKINKEVVVPVKDVQSEKSFKPYPHWIERKTMFEHLPNHPNEIIFLGNSITEGGCWSELFDKPAIRNRGIGNDMTEGVLLRLSECTESKPLKIFIMIGINDLNKNLTTKEVLKNYKLIVDKIKSESPATKIYVQSVLPVNIPNISNDTIIVLNKYLKNLSDQQLLTYVNLFDSFKDEKGGLKTELTTDGVHLKIEGYLLWKSLIEKYVDN